MTDKPADQPMEEERTAEDSQDIVIPFSLHLTQSQTDMDSQPALEASQPMEVIQQVMYKGIKPKIDLLLKGGFCYVVQSTILK